MLKGFLTTNQGKTKLSIISFVILFLTFSLFLAGGVFSQDNYDAPEEGECNFTINESMVESFEGKVLINGDITININQLSDVYTVNETLQNSINSAPDVTPIEVSLSGDYEGNVRINPVEVEGGGEDEVQLWAKDSEGNWHNIVESGWGPVDTGFPINESAVTDVYPLGNEGTYTINISVVAINGTEAREILVSENRNVSFGIQSAIDNANSGDVIQVSSGTYEESVKITKPITIESIAGPEETIIDATGKGRAFQIQTNNVNGSNITIEGFNITGNKTISTGITIREGQSSVKETNFVIKNNHFYNLAAGINAWGFGAYNNSWKNRVESIKIKNNKFTNLGEQGVQNGGAILLETLGNQNRTGGDYAAIIENNSFDNIFSLNSEAPGAGVVLQWKVFIGNETELNDSAANAKVVGNDFGNVALDVAVGGNTTNTLIRENNFGDGGIGVMTKNIGMGSVDATHNYWGHPSGPNRTVSDNASNDSNWIGQGDRVGENVSYVPWYPTENLIVLIDDNKPGRGNIENKREIKRENISVEFEGNTSLKGNDNWNGIFYIIEKDNVSEEGTAPSFSGKNTHIGKVIEIGSNTTQLNFSKPVKIVIYGEAGKDVGWTRAGEDFNKIEECSKNFDNATEANESLENFDECKIDINNSLIIWTTHFTEFVTYETSPTETSSGGSGSSGGGGMGICATEWNCTDWSECVNGTQTRNCSYPEGFCEPTEEKPEENRTCPQPEEDDVGGEEKETEEDFEKNQTDLVDEPTTQTSGFITGFVTGIKKGNTKDISVLVIILAVLGLIIYYRSSTIAGLSKRAEKLHKKADKLNKKGEHNRASRVRNKARDFQVRADKKSY